MTAPTRAGVVTSARRRSMSTSPSRRSTTPSTVTVSGWPGSKASDRFCSTRCAGWLGHRQVTVKPVIDLPGTPAVDRYEVPPTMAEAVKLRTPADCFPYSPNTSGSKATDRPLHHRLTQPAGSPCPGSSVTRSDPPRQPRRQVTTDRPLHHRPTQPAGSLYQGSCVTTSSTTPAPPHSESCNLPPWKRSASSRPAGFGWPTPSMDRRLRRQWCCSTLSATGDPTGVQRLPGSPKTSASTRWIFAVMVTATGQVSTRSRSWPRTCSDSSTSAAWTKSRW